MADKLKPEDLKTVAEDEDLMIIYDSPKEARDVSANCNTSTSNSKSSANSDDDSDPIDNRKKRKQTFFLRWQDCPTPKKPGTKKLFKRIKNFRKSKKRTKSANRSVAAAVVDLEEECSAEFADVFIDAENESTLISNSKFLPVVDGDVPQVKIDEFSIYDEANQLRRFDSGLMEKGVNLYLNGLAEPVVSDGLSKPVVAVNNIGPIKAWWIAGYDGGDQVLIALSTKSAEYYLKEPSHRFRDLYANVLEKAYFCKLVVELLEKDYYATIENLMDMIEVPRSGLPRLTFESLINHGQFIVDQVSSYDDAADDDEPIKLMESNLIRVLVNYSGASIESRRDSDHINERNNGKTVKRNKLCLPKATTTPLVYNIMKSCNVFIEHIINKPMRQKNCASEMEVIDIDSESDMIEVLEEIPTNMNRISESIERSFKEEEAISWCGQPSKLCGRENVYFSALKNDQTLRAGDYVTLNPKFKSEMFSVARIVYMFDDENGKHFHAQYFSTILGLTADEDELFMCDTCHDLPIVDIKNKCQVRFQEVNQDWRMMGGLQYNPNMNKSSTDRVLFYQKWYDEENSRIVDCPLPRFDHTNTLRLCESCSHQNTRKKVETPQIDDNMTTVHWREAIFKVGDCVFMESDVKPIRSSQPADKDPKINEDDDVKYPEMFRKSSSIKKVPVVPPFQIGQILSFQRTISFRHESSLTPKDIKVTVRFFFRPEETDLNSDHVGDHDFNLVYWTRKVKIIDLSLVLGKCTVAFGGSVFPLWSMDDYFTGGPLRFYFNKGYNQHTDSFFKVDKEVEAAFNVENLTLTRHPVVNKKLVALDVFCGCGGLSEGFRRSGLIESKWAIDNNEEAAAAYSLNNPQATVFHEDCNDFLKLLQEGKSCDERGNLLPKKGKVDIILGGPPCQGFSFLNRFRTSSYSKLSNSRIAVFLSFVEFFRPKYFILESVKTIINHEGGLVLKSSIRTALAMGYQSTFAVLQSGNYGVAQSRRRFFLIGAAPDQRLPSFPEPLHAFSSKSTNIAVDGIEYHSNIKWRSSAPLRQLNVYDIISDLPAIENGHDLKIMKYSEPKTHFQRLIRKGSVNSTVCDHICKDMTPIDVARMMHIPTRPGSDWRDLPNIAVALSDGSLTDKLTYKYDNVKNGKSKTGNKRGVCPCATGRPFEKHANQKNTLIPWFLPHTANTNSNWAGLYGRLQWSDYFRTTITNPEPMGKMGCVIHPEQHRVVSVRECARSQGFHDSFKFEGDILAKHKQIGNAVPVPLAYAIALEFIKCM